MTGSIERGVTDAQAGEFGLLNWDGSVNERALATGHMSDQLQKHAALFAGREYRAEVAILIDQSTLRQGAAEGYEAVQSADKNYWQRSWMGAYKLLWDMNVPVDFVADAHVLDGSVERYKLLLIPFRPNIADDVSDRLASYVENGGRVIAEFPLGMKDNVGTLRYAAPGSALSDVFGCQANDAMPAQDKNIQLGSGLVDGGGTLPVFVFQQELQPLAGAEVLGAYASGGAALVSNRHGRGEALLAGTLVFAAYAEGWSQYSQAAN